ncbi:hypothetical protein FKP32DRAFT_604990 [Trametes sanguinea]|nr:hypothetical protein FKP32DRAFT_604990 [Trametes sanguinea]
MDDLPACSNVTSKLPDARAVGIAAAARVGFAAAVDFPPTLKTDWSRPARSPAEGDSDPSTFPPAPMAARCHARPRRTPQRRAEGHQCITNSICPYHTPARRRKSGWTAKQMWPGRAHVQVYSGAGRDPRCVCTICDRVLRRSRAIAAFSHTICSPLHDWTFSARRWENPDEMPMQEVVGTLHQTEGQAAGPRRLYRHLSSRSMGFVRGGYLCAGVRRI